MIPFFVFLTCLFATYATFLLTTRKRALRRAQTGQRLAEALSYPSDLFSPEVRLSRTDVLSEIPWLDQWLSQVQTARQLKQLIAQADLRLTVSRLCLFTLLAAISGALMASVLIDWLPVVLGTGLVTAGLPFLYLLQQRKKRFDKFLLDLPDTLELMSRALAAGHAFQEALYIVATEMPDPVATEFGRTYEEQRLGLSTKVALENLMQRVPLLDLKLCVIAILIQRETGGNLAEILEKVAHTVRERFRIMEDLKTLTMSSRMSAWLLCAVPIFVMVMVTWLNPEYMNVMWYDPRGHKLLALAAAMQITGMLLIQKILRIQI